MKGFSNFVRKHTGLCCVILAVLLVFSVIAGISLGPVNIPFRDVWRIIFNKLFGSGNIDDIKTGTQNIVWFIRIPRVLLGLAVGGGLTLSGVGMQAFTKNPLAEPYVLGISSGASAGAVLAIIASVVLPWGKMSISFGSFVGALLSIIIVYTLSRSGGDITPIRLVLVGVAVSAIFRALTNFIVYTAPSDAQVRQATFWMLGGLGSAEWSDLIITYVVLIPSAVVMMIFARPLNAMMMGDSSAITLGVNVNAVRKLLIFLTAVLTSAAVAVSGCIGFVGLIVPHIVRSVTGADHSKVIPLSLLCGSIFMIWADVAARLVCAPAELPVGILTALFGGPLFLWMVRKRRYEFGK